MQRDKVKSLLGFAVKAGKVLYGIDTIERSKRYYVICLCDTASDNTKKKVTNLAQKNGVPVILALSELSNIVNRINCKVIAVTDKQMSQAMVNNLGNDYRLLNSEVK